MITEKSCETCEHYDYRAGYCWKIHETMYQGDVCACWEPRAGDWISCEVCKPKDGEAVAIWTESKFRNECIYHDTKRAFEGIYDGIEYNPNNVPYWLRYPEVREW